MSDVLSLVVPAYNEEEGIQSLATSVTRIMDEHNIPFELIIVNDGSKDSTYEKICNMATLDARIKGVSFSRNFGKEAAMLAGMQYAVGGCCIILDSDLQHPPEIIPEMYRLWKEDHFQIVEGIKSSRGKESVFHNFFAAVFYSSISRAIKVDIKNASDFKLVDRKVVDVLLSLPEKNTFFRGLTFWTGYRMTTVVYEVQPRIHGATKWSFIKLVKYAVNNIVSFSAAPLNLINIMAGIMLFVAVFFSVRAFLLYLTNQSAGGITTVVILLLFIGGLILLSLGIIGKYIASIYEEVKNRPRYLVEQTTFIEK